MTSYDATAIFCPDTGLCYFIRNDEVTTTKDITLRIGDPKKLWKQKTIRWAEDFKQADRIFDRAS